MSPETSYEPSPWTPVADQVALYEATDGKEGGTLEGKPVVILSTRAARPVRCASPRHAGGARWPLRRGGVDGRRAAAPRLVPQPRGRPPVTLQDGADVMELRAHTADEAERAEWWPRRRRGVAGVRRLPDEDRPADPGRHPRAGLGVSSRWGISVPPPRGPWGGSRPGVAAGPEARRAVVVATAPGPPRAPWRGSRWPTWAPSRWTARPEHVRLEGRVRVARRAFPRHGPLDEQHGPIGDGEHAVDLLLDDQERASLPVDGDEPVVDLVDDDRRQAEGELVHDEQLGGTASTLANDRIRCCPPDSVPPCWRRRSARTGNASRRAPTPRASPCGRPGG